ncbi:uncharacterized protein LOC122859593 isoform X3 [Aphidius gifuensis]|uniref:uncharacterized protein LOC122859593 isoform X3 n=1 Tax=Aphidius gifuensis TaxID=684658 RepID=UPI001CDC3697|nr:uncharacterized protein LOC122859593 isoform X3 [Aphidius gifuensis]
MSTLKNKKRRGPYMQYAAFGSQGVIPERTARDLMIKRKKLCEKNKGFEYPAYKQINVQLESPDESISNTNIGILSDNNSLHHYDISSQTSADSIESPSVPSSFISVNNIQDDFQLLHEEQQLINIDDPATLMNDTVSCSRNYDFQTLQQCLLLAAFKYRHKEATYSLMEDFSKILHATNNNYKKISKYTFQKMVNNFSMGVSIHHICLVCEKYLGNSNFLSNDEEYENINGFIFCDTCKSKIDKKQNIKEGNIFLYISLIEQLKAKFSLEGDLSNYFNTRKMKNENAIEDIFDESEKRQGDDTYSPFKFKRISTWKGTTISRSSFSTR